MQQFSIPAGNMEAFTTAIEKAAAKAAKLGCSPVGYTTIEVKVEAEIETEEASPLYVEDISRQQFKWVQTPLTDAQRAKDTGNRRSVHVVEVFGEAPKYAGWQFVAVLDAMNAEDGERINIIRPMPGESCPVEYRDMIGVCQHCNQNRRRNQTFVVRHDSGETKSVGRTCIRDFLGGASPEQIAAQAEFMAGLSAACSGFESMDGGSFKKEWSLEHVLSWVVSKVDADGWVSRTVARDCGKQATIDKVLWLLSPLHPLASSEERQQWKEDGERLKPTAAHHAEAQAAIKWAGKIEAKEDEDYLANLNTIARIGTVERKTAGLGGSMITAYRRAMEREVKREEFAKRDARPAGVHVGEVGKRIKSITLTCEMLKKLEGAYGVTGMHKFIDAAGNELVWFASGSTEWFAEGETLEVAATPKSHGEYKGRPQTVLSRVTIKKAKAAA